MKALGHLDYFVEFRLDERPKFKMAEVLRQFRCTNPFLSILPQTMFFFTFGVGAVVYTVICSI